MDEEKRLVAPFWRQGCDTRGMMMAMLVCLTLTAAHFSARYDSAYLLRFVLLVLAGWAIECMYVLLRDGRPAWPHASTGVTTALLALSVPAHMPFLQVASGVLVAVLFGKLMVDRKALRFNPMLLGRLFLMLLFASSIQQWLDPGTTIDAFTSATPLGLYKSEGATVAARDLLWGSVRGDWGDGFVAVIPGSPGDLMPLLSLFFGVVLYTAGVIDWRPGVAFVAGFALMCPLLGLPLGFHLLSGSLFFTAVYIVTDPRTLPGSKAGRLLAGLLAGGLNAVVRWHGYFPEGVVVAVLVVNGLSPTLDRLAFFVRGYRLARRQQ